MSPVTSRIFILTLVPTKKAAACPNWYATPLRRRVALSGGDEESGPTYDDTYASPVTTSVASGAVTLT